MAQPARPIASKVDRSAPGGAPGLDARYERFMSQPSVRSFVHRCGQVFLATERQPASSVRSLIALGHFRLLRRLADGAQLEGCCMGMSDDFQVAIRCGATAIRIGRAVFDASGE
jgi:hypothetical protein